MAHDGLNMDIQFLPGVGPKRADLLQKELGISTTGELMRLYPFRYIDRSSFVCISDARPDMAMIQIKATVKRVDLYGSSASKDAIIVTEGLKFNTIRRMSVWVADGTGEMEMVFFKGIKWMYERLKPGSEFVFFGKPTSFNGRINVVHPEVDPVPTGTATEASGTMTGVYPSTEKLKNGGVTGKVMNKIMEAALDKGLVQEKETVSYGYQRSEHGYHGLSAAHVSLQQPVHLQAALHISMNLPDHPLLGSGQVERERCVALVERFSDAWHRNAVHISAAYIFLLQQRQLEQEEFLELEPVFRLLQRLHVLREVYVP